ncbi:MAG: NAD(P)/FAD-dependent oxidoreductase [Flavobacteriales bacterium]|nr:NAD(P)/FAD-dependent oxidoreductase [Flavobacteriales bacterium]
MKIAIIGGGAAGFFSAMAAKENYPTATVVILEKTQNLLSKVKVSGGGKCNVTNACFSIKELSSAYPRGGKKLKKSFQVFNAKDTLAWFESRGVPLVIRKDQHVFPASQSSQSIIDCFLKEAERLGILIEMGAGITSITQVDGQLELSFSRESLKPRTFDKVIVGTGGSPKRMGLEWLETMGHQIEDPVPSLFTFNMPKESITNLMGVVAENALVGIQGTKLKSKGPLLITHWGMSGPAILKLSAFGARILSDLEYNFNIQVNWVNEKNSELVMNHLKDTAAKQPNKILANVKPYSLPQRMWSFLLERSDLRANKKWGDLGKKHFNKLTNVLCNDVYTVKGKTTFKEEFVTCGGVSLDSINFNTMESKICKNLYFAGEIMDIDGITGGYNFQSAWTTGFIAGKLS